MPDAFADTLGADTTNDRASEASAEQFLVLRLGNRRFALPAHSVERIVRMAALTPLPDAPPEIAGLLDLQGALLVTVDPRPRLGLPPGRPQVDQQLVVVQARSRYVLWVDRTEQVAVVASHEAVPAKAAHGLASVAIRVGGEVLPVLAPEALDPGPRPPSQRDAPP